MNNKVNYTLVGFVVLVGIVMMLGFVYWLMQPSSENETRKYLVRFNESVLGLNVDAPVKYRGIVVGKVKSLKINPENIEEVEVLVEILQSTPIKVDTVAKLTAQGITGLSYINLSMGSSDAHNLTIEDGDKYPVIKTVPSFFENFENSLGSVSSKLSTTLSQTEKLLNDENQRQITLVLQRTANILEKIDNSLDEKTIQNSQETIQNLNEITQKMNALTPDIERLVNNSIEWEGDIKDSFSAMQGSFDSIMQSYQGIKASMAEFKKVLESGQFNVKDIAGEVVPNVNNTLIDVQELMIKLDSVMENYDRTPNDILFKQEATKKGPGEE
jgi:phospholipid/cholesterol/gamma-HCH transport system substrate-binding protein